MRMFSPYGMIPGGTYNRMGYYNPYLPQIYGAGNQQQLCTPIGTMGTMPGMIPAPQNQSKAPAQTKVNVQGKTPVKKTTASEAAVHPIKKAEAKKVNHALSVSNFTANDLTEEALDQIVGKYGIEIDDIYNLAPGQEWMFAQAKTVTSAFFTQALFRAVIKIKPSTFRQKVDEVCKAHDNLRTAFAHENMKKPYQVVLKNRTADLRFLDMSSTAAEDMDDVLKNIMDADRRRGFDLENDKLLRIAIYKTCEEDTYAILISQPHINNDGASTGILLKELFLDYAMEGEGLPTEELDHVSFGKYAEWLENLDKTEEINYWKEVLKDLPPLTKAPGYVASNMTYDMSTKGLSFESDVNKKIRKMQGTYKATISNIMMTAWGIMLQKLYGTSDVTFAAITSGRGVEVQKSEMITGGMVNAVPVRIRVEEDVTFATQVKNVQKQFTQSLEYSHCSPMELQDAIGRTEPIFDHLLNFHNFAGADDFSNAPKIPGITLLDSESFDNLSTDLCLYFMMQRGSFVCNFTYNKNTFTDTKIKILMDCFKQVLLQIAENDPELKISQIECPDISVFAAADREEEAEKQNITSFICGLSVFQGVDETALRELADFAKITSYVADDIIISEKKQIDKLSFVMEGYVELAREAMDGWTNSLMSLKAGKLISVEGILEGVPTYTLARAISKEVKVLSFQREIIWKYIEKYPCISLNIMKELEGISKSYSFLWLSSDQ